jgi:hypothetical protein
MRKNGAGRLVTLVGGLLIGCGEDEAAKKACNLAEPTNGCPAPQVCEDAAGQPICVAPVVIRGKVIDPSGKAIAGALVAGLDANDAPATGTATSAADGRYELRVPVARDAAGAPAIRQVRLRAAAAGFESFPSGLRRSLPLELSGAMLDAGKLAFQSTATEIVLSPVANASGLGSIAGTVGGPAGKRGVLVVAEGPVTATAISDTDGAYEIFNVAPGAYTVKGYAAGVQLSPANASVTAAGRIAGVNLSPRDVALGTVTGSVNIVNAPGGSLTSVVLIVASTFNEALKRGEMPPGLRAARTSGSFTVTDVPDGDYRVLAAFENDFLVRDPDTSIGGTEVPRITVGDASRQVTLAAGFKVTGALAITRPGAGEVPELMLGPPTFVWTDDSSEERYTLEVIDSKGNVVWLNENVAKQTGGEVSVVYGGPALRSGALYQFRVTSFRRGNVAISMTEDLRGVFLMQ